MKVPSRGEFHDQIREFVQPAFLSLVPDPGSQAIWDYRPTASGVDRVHGSIFNGTGATEGSPPKRPEKPLPVHCRASLKKPSTSRWEART